MEQSSASPGRILFLHGPSSSGKSTLARALQQQLDELFVYISIDHWRDGRAFPVERLKRGDFDWSAHRPSFFEGFHRCIPALAHAGNHLIVEHIVETPEWRDRLADLLADLDVFVVGLRCELPELERRERGRGDRPIGEARRDYETDRSFLTFDLEVDGMADPHANAEKVLRAWRARGGGCGLAFAPRPSDA